VSEPASAIAAAEPPRKGDKLRTACLVILALAAVTAGLYYGRAVFVPLFMAAVFTALLRPVVRFLERAKLPTALAATLVVLVSLALLTGAVFAFAGPVRTWVKEEPYIVATARQKLGSLVGRGPLAGILPTAGADSAQGRGGRTGDARSQAGGPTSADARSPGGGADGPGAAGKVLGATSSFVGAFVEVLLLVWFLLASGTLFQRKLLHVLPLPWEKRTALDVLDQTESVVSGYLLTTLLINLGQGAAVALAMWLIGVPTPLLWGMLTVGAEFIPYLGAAGMLILLTAVGLATFPDALHVLLPPGAYLLISTLQNNLVSPLAYGRKLRLNPVAVLVGVMVFWTLWGVAGAFLSVPIVATAKVLGDRLDGLAAVGEFLGD
jgi:predicted PurR-regulated permease PerM